MTTDNELILKNLKVPVIVGPTASGKTALAIKIAQEFGFEIISADSRQLVKEMNIGTAKPTAAEQASAPHHFIDIIEPIDDLYNSFQYGIQVREKLLELHQSGKKALIVGGSGLYIQSAIHGFFEDLEISDKDKACFRYLINRFSPDENYKKLLIIDPDYAATVPAGNRQRVNRALEVFFFTGIRMSDWQKDHQPEQFFQPVYIGLTPPREILYERINHRVEVMLADGLVEEVKQLAEKYGSDLKRLHKTIGYSEVIDFLAEKSDIATMVDKIQTNSRHYAKRQLTWFKRIKEVKWFEDAGDNGVLDFLRGQLD